MTQEQAALATTIVQVVIGICTIIALIAGPIIAVNISDKRQRENQRSLTVRHERMHVFRVLMAHRKNPFHADRLSALATIDVVFHDDPEVRKKWKEYYDDLANPVYADQQNNAYEVWARRQNYLLAAIASSLGFTDITAEDIERSYIPDGLGKINELQISTALEWFRVLQHSDNLGSPDMRQPPPSGPLTQNP